MITVTLIFLLCTIVSVVATAMGKCPVWVPLLLLTVTVALMILPK